MDPSTLAVVVGRPDGAGAMLTPPVSLTSTYRADGPIVYGRDDNPTWRRYEAALGELEDAEAVLFSSGMAAVSAVVLPALRPVFDVRQDSFDPTPDP